MNERDQPLEGYLVALSPLEKKRGDAGGMVGNAPFYPTPGMQVGPTAWCGISPSFSASIYRRQST